MNGFKTSRDRILKATGGESEINWQDLPNDVVQQLLNKISKGNTEEDIAVPQLTTPGQPNTIRIFGKTFTLQETLQASCLFLQVVTLITTIIIAHRIK